ncbi:MAG: hypothetical protein BroJett018_05970 [Chloroflexota bacterium]|nr:hypothetical protein [Chloroflexota bacterium]GIK62803.1 MAG: hypothetical protein BroJett018_05970 [Chloroflexota bacterium]
MTNEARKLSDLHGEFKRHSHELYFSKPTVARRRELILERQRIAGEIRRIKSSQGSAEREQLRIAGSSDQSFVKKMSSKGIIIRYAEI